MKQYHELLAKQETVKAEIKAEKLRLHKEFMKTHAKQVRVLDILVILIIVMNWGALLITNAMVERKAAIAGEVPEYVELNPVQAEANNWNYAPIEVSKPVVQMLLRQVIAWAILGGIYLHNRKYVYTEEMFFVMIYIIAFYFLVLGSDFINDLGFLIGKVLFR